jgi:hypothetical protein
MTDLHKYSYPESANLTTLHLPCHRLDDYIKQQNLELIPNILLKLDVQGAEMLVLTGTTDILSKTLLVFIEANFNKLYTDSILISDLVLYFKSIGFRMAGVENVSQSMIDGQFLQCDVYFIKEDYQSIL